MNDTSHVPKSKKFNASYRLTVKSDAPEEGRCHRGLIEKGPGGGRRHGDRDQSECKQSSEVPPTTPVDRVQVEEAQPRRRTSQQAQARPRAPWGS